MEVNYNENGEYNEDGEEDSEEEEENTESDEDDYGAYTVASKEDFVHVETKTKVSIKICHLRYVFCFWYNLSKIEQITKKFYFEP